MSKTYRAYNKENCISFQHPYKQFKMNIFCGYKKEKIRASRKRRYALKHDMKTDIKFL